MGAIPSLRGDEVVHRRDIEIEAHQPTVVSVTFAAPTPSEDPPSPNAKRGTVSLDTSGRIASITVTGEDELPIFEQSRAFRLDPDCLLTHAVALCPSGSA